MTNKDIWFQEHQVVNAETVLCKLGLENVSSFLKDIENHFRYYLF